MQHQGIFRAILIIGLLADLGVVGFLATEKPKPVTVEAWEPFQSQDAGFSLKYPKEWKSSETKGPMNVEARFTTENDIRMSAMASLKGALITDLIKFNPTSNEPPLKQCHEMLVDNIEAGCPHFKEAATTPVMVGKLKALSTTYDYRIMDGLRVRSMKGSVVSIWNGKDHMALRLTCPADKFENLLPLFGTFMQSFKCKVPVPENTGGGEIPLPMPF